MTPLARARARHHHARDTCTPEAPFPAIHLFHAGGREAEIDEVFRRILATRRAARPGGNRVRLRCARRAGVGKGAAPRLAGHARRRHPRHVHAARPRAARPVRLDRDRLLGRPLPPPAAVGRRQRRRRETASARARRRACWRGSEPDGDAPPTASRWTSAQGATTRAPPIRTRRTTTAPTRTARASRRRSVRAWIDGLRGRRSRTPRRRPVPLQAVVGRARSRSSNSSTARSNALDHRAAAALHEYIGELRALGAFACALPQALRFMRERVRVADGGARTSAPRASLRVRARRRPATPAARTSSSSGSKKAACSRRPPRTRCCSTPSARRSRRDLRAVDRPDRRGRVRRAEPARRRRRARSPSATRAATRASSARPTPRG